MSTLRISTTARTTIILIHESSIDHDIHIATLLAPYGLKWIALYATKQSIRVRKRKASTQID